MALWGSQVTSNSPAVAASSSNRRMPFRIASVASAWAARVRRVSTPKATSSARASSRRSSSSDTPPGWGK